MNELFLRHPVTKFLFKGYDKAPKTVTEATINMNLINMQVAQNLIMKDIQCTPKYSAQFMIVMKLSRKQKILQL